MTWSAERKVADPDVWVTYTATVTLGLDLPAAVSRYGRQLTLDVAAGRPMWSRTAPGSG